MAWRLVCAITNHSPPFVYSVRDGCRWKMEGATLAELLEDLAEFHHVNCGCSIKVGQNVWTTSLDICLVLDLDTVEDGSADTLPLHTLLDSVPCPPSEERAQDVHLLVSGEQSVHTDYLALWREHTFVAHVHRNARVFTRHRHPKPGPRPPPLLPTPDLTSYVDMCDTPGLCFVDKSDQVNILLSHLARSRVSILRRPKGFGKTTLLSTVADFFDINSPAAYFPFVFSSQDMSKFPFSCHNRLLVFSLDFAELDLDVDPPGAHAECRRLVDRAAKKFYSQYKDVFSDFEPEHASTFVPSYVSVMGFVVTHGLKLFLSIDNYTTPIIQRHQSPYEHAIPINISGLLDDLLIRHHIYCGLVVGETLPPHLAHTRLLSGFVDVSDEDAFMDIIGFTPDEVTVLGNVAGVDILKEMLPVSSQPLGTKFVYAAAHAVSVARDLIDTGRCRPHAEYPYHTMFLPPDGAASPPVQPQLPTVMSDDSVSDSVTSDPGSPGLSLTNSCSDLSSNTSATFERCQRSPSPPLLVGTPPDKKTEY